MALNLGTLYVQLSTKNDQLIKGFNEAERKLDAFASKVTKLGKTLTLGITTPLTLVGRQAIMMAGDVVESEALFEVSMGNMTKTAHAFTRQFAKDMKINEYEMRKQMGIFKVMAESMGLTEQSAYDLSKGFTTLAYDLAAFYNISFESAFEKLQSGMVGMVMPLRELGININETTVENYALRNGLIKQGETLSETGKVVARYGAIMEQSRKAQGHLARELDNPLSQFRSLKEQVKAVTIEFGQALLPMFSQALSIIIPFVERLRDMAKAFQQLPEATQQAYVKLGLFIGLIGPATTLLGGLVKVVASLSGLLKGLVTFGSRLIFALSAWAGGAATFGEALSLLVGGPIGWVILGVAALIGIGYLLIKNWKDVSHWGLQTWGKIKVWIYEAVVALNKFMESIALTPEAKEHYRNQVTRHIELIETERSIMDERQAQYEADKEAKSAVEKVKEEVSTLFNDDFWNNLNINLNTTQAKKSIEDIENELQSALKVNLELEVADPTFDRLGADLDAYRNAIKQLIEGGYTDSEAYAGIVSEYRYAHISSISQTLQKELDYNAKMASQMGDDFDKTSADLDALRNAISEMIESGYMQTQEFENLTKLYQQKLRESKTPSGAYGFGILTDTMQEKLFAISTDALKGEQGTAIVDLAEQINQLTKDTAIAWASATDPTEVADILTSYQQQLRNFASMADYLGAHDIGGQIWLSAEALGSFIRDLTLEGLKRGLEGDLQKAYDIAYATAESDPEKAGVEAQINVLTSRLADYIMAGGSVEDEWAQMLKTKLQSLRESIQEADTTFEQEKANIEADLRRTLDLEEVARKMAEAKGEEFSSEQYRAQAYENAIRQLQSLMILYGFTTEEIIEATQKWIDDLRNVYTPDKSFYQTISEQLQKDLEQLPLAEALTVALGEEFDAAQYKVNAYEKAIQSLQEEMLNSGATIEDVLEATKLWRYEIGKLKKEMSVSGWLKDTFKGLLSKSPLAYDAYESFQTAKTAFKGTGIGGLAGGLIGAVISLVSSSETFGHILNNINPILEATSNALGLFIEPLLPIVHVLGQTLSPILSVLGEILSTLLVPMMRPLFEGLKLVGVVANALGAGLYGLMGVLYTVSSSLTNLSYQIFLWLPGFKGVEASLLSLKNSLDESADNAYKQMRKMWTDAGELSKLTWEEALEGAKSLNEIGKETAEALRNVPSGFKVALARFDATKAVNMAGSEVGTTDLKQIIVNYYGDSYGFDDFKRTITDIVRDANGNALLTEYGY